MTIVINIDDSLYTKLFDNGKIDAVDMLKACATIRKGKAIPKGYGRLEDLDKIKKEMQDYYDDCAKTSEYTRLGFETAIAIVEDADTIIEADKIKDEAEESRKEPEADDIEVKNEFQYFETRIK